MIRILLSFYRPLVVNKKQSITTGFSEKPKGKLDNAAGTCRIFIINWMLYLIAAQCYLTESTARSISLSFVASVVLLCTCWRIPCVLGPKGVVTVCMKSICSPTQFPSLFPSVLSMFWVTVFSMRGPMAELLVFVRHGSGLPLGAGFQ